MNSGELVARLDGAGTDGADLRDGCFGASAPPHEIAGDDGAGSPESSPAMHGHALPLRESRIDGGQRRIELRGGGRGEVAHGHVHLAQSVPGELRRSMGAFMQVHKHGNAGSREAREGAAGARVRAGTHPPFLGAPVNPRPEVVDKTDGV